MSTDMITLRHVFQAAQTIAPIARRTPLVSAELLSERVETAVSLKLETLQPTGAFKIRGAANKILNLDAAARQRGVVTVSTGNHGRAVAYVARHLGIPATVCISELVPQNKVEALQRLEPTLVIHGQSQDEAGERAVQLQEEEGLTMIPPFDDPDIIAGQGTIGLEILADLPEVDAVLVPLSGGGLISGIALALKSAGPQIRVIGVSMERGAVMYHSLGEKRPIRMAEEPTLADSLQGGIGLDNRYTFQMVGEYVDEVVLVSEDEIAEAMAFTLKELRLVAEGAAVVGIAALLGGKIKNPGQQVAVVLSGGNVDMNTLLEVAAKS